uniref:homeobox protein prophet of Pit-1-like n=1 Tax=Jaculus jaculus TaxID=51337 RepID=UPI001E1AF78F|nr:homeobox protein prophet of Pit-1-like [Jaculus jaculus]
MAPVSPETGFFAAPYSPSVYSGFGVFPSFQDPPSLPGSRKLPSLPRPPRSAHLPKPYNAEKRQRIVYTHWQKKLLEAAFEKNQYPSHGDCVSLAKRADITQPQIKIWFKNHRAKMSKLQRQQHSEEGPWVSRQGACAAVASAGPSCPGSNDPASVPASADAGCPGPSGVIFPTPPHSSSSVDRDSGGYSASDQQSVWDEQVPGRAKDGPVRPATATSQLQDPVVQEQLEPQAQALRQLQMPPPMQKHPLARACACVQSSQHAKRKGPAPLLQEAQEQMTKQPLSSSGRSSWKTWTCPGTLTSPRSSHPRTSSRNLRSLEDIDLQGRRGLEHQD